MREGSCPPSLVIHSAIPSCVVFARRGDMFCQCVGDCVKWAGREVGVGLATGVSARGRWRDVRPVAWAFAGAVSAIRHLQET
jgi:hypothetical protein